MTIHRHIPLGVALILAACWFGTGCAAGDRAGAGEGGNADFSEQDLFVGRAGSYPVFRIPSLIESAQGTLLAFAEGRASIADDGDIDIVLKRSFDGGRTWTRLQVVAENGFGCKRRVKSATVRRAKSVTPGS